MIIVNIPFNTVKLTSDETPLMEFASGFWEVERSGEGALGSRGKTLISNLVSQALLNYRDIGVGEQILFRLVPAKPGNPGKDDEPGSLTDSFGGVV
jgi:hypothetical protein